MVNVKTFEKTPTKVVANYETKYIVDIRRDPEVFSVVRVGRTGFKGAVIQINIPR